MQELQPLESLTPLQGLEIRLNSQFEKNNKKYYSNLDLVCMSTELLYKAHLVMEQIQQKRSYKTISIDEHKSLLLQSNNLTKKGFLLLKMYEKDSIFWNDKDIENKFKKLMLGNVKEC